MYLSFMAVIVLWIILPWKCEQCPTTTFSFSMLFTLRCGQFSTCSRGHWDNSNSEILGDSDPLARIRLRIVLVTSTQYCMVKILDSLRRYGLSGLDSDLLWWNEFFIDHVLA